MKADSKAEPASAPNGSKKKMLIMIIMAVVVIGLGAGAAWFFMQDKPAGAAQKVASTEPPVYVPIESFTVNLQPETGEQFLQIAFTLQVQNAKEGETIKANMAKVRSRVLLLLSGKKASEISTVEGKQLLAKEIVAAVKQPFVDKGEAQQVSDVLFTAFIIQ
ncbi:flagellar basal body-associated protein FliL [Massilia eurypsychrophila]|jgi:flagellar FliL protein|uniref:Flagellar protein FliL n=1 Tax=Massilia eurypsychrophila TaxID=1485217 RepID=A0A2G8TBN1_9BURK|nr:flagellar basal body-associated protein FliL [Massilia eurypsychrophila]PIL43451.1 flagellar basal body-associated protein FliL [Massilia eurypsychrophila]